MLNYWYKIDHNFIGASLSETYIGGTCVCYLSVYMYVIIIYGTTVTRVEPHRNYAGPRIPGACKNNVY